MPAQSPLDILADELGAASGRIERELRQECAKLKAENTAFRSAIAERFSAMEVMFFKAEQERERVSREKLEKLASEIPSVSDLVDEIMGQMSPMMDEMRRAMVDVQGRLEESVMKMEAPESIVSDVNRALAAIESQPINERLPAFILNVNSSEPKKKTITMRKDRDGNPFADIVEG